MYHHRHLAMPTRNSFWYVCPPTFYTSFSKNFWKHAKASLSLLSLKNKKIMNCRCLNILTDAFSVPVCQFLLGSFPHGFLPAGHGQAEGGGDSRQTSKQISKAADKVLNQRPETISTLRVFGQIGEFPFQLLAALLITRQVVGNLKESLLPYATKHLKVIEHQHVVLEVT